MRVRDLFQAIPLDETDTAAPWFRAWFGDSKVVNDAGQPLLVYHGTANPGFAKFRDKGGLGGAIGFWFASSRQAATVFARQRFAGVMPGVKVCALRIVNPMEYDGHSAFVAAVQARMKGGSVEDGMKALRRALIRAGYDGLVIRNSDTDGGGLRDDWVAFKPDQIVIVGALD